MNALPIAIAGTQQLEPRWSMKCMSDSLSVQYKLRVRAFWRLWANKGRHVDNAITISERRGLCTLSKKVPTLTPNSDSGWKQHNFKWNIFVWVHLSELNTPPLMLRYLRWEREGLLPIRGVLVQTCRTNPKSSHISVTVCNRLAGTPDRHLLPAQCLTQKTKGKHGCSLWALFLYFINICVKIAVTLSLWLSEQHWS